jgi:inorganic triphosphatase YgiF
MSGPREVEGVLLVCAEDAAAAGRRLAALEAVAGFELLSREPQRIRDVHLDTGDGALGGARVAFRVRELDGRPLLTLKADARRAGGAAERLELEGPWSAETLQATLGELRRRGIPVPDPDLEPGVGRPLEVLAGVGLHPTQVRETTRTPRDVVAPGRGAGPVAELAIDDVAFLLPAGAVRLLEVEVEAKGPGGLGTVQALLEGLAQAFPDVLRPWPYGKLVTGRAVEQLLAAGRLEGLLDPAGRLRPAAYDRLAEALARQHP